MDKNYAIGSVVVVAVLILGGYFLFKDGGLMNQSGSQNMATSTSTSTNTNTNNTPTNPSGTIQAALPVVQTDTSVEPSNSTAVLNGHVTPNGAPTTYWYEFGESNSLGSKTSSQSVGSGFVRISSPGYVTGLRANTLYFFRLSASNRFGTVNGAIYSFSTNSNPPPQGNKPSASTNSATDVLRTTATLNAHVDPNSAETTYWFEYGIDSNLGSISSFQSAGNGNSSLAVNAPLSGLNALTKYFYRINAQNQFGTVNGSISNFTTKGPASPGVPKVDTTSPSSVSTSTANFNGQLTPNGAATTYWFEYSQDSLLGSILGTMTAEQTLNGNAETTSVTANVKNLNNNTKYFFRLIGRNQYGTVEGDMVSFTTK